jgi:hypothetical protein
VQEDKGIRTKNSRKSFRTQETFDSKSFMHAVLMFPSMIANKINKTAASKVFFFNVVYIFG